ncbi:UNVERIFIED_CONTAM: hypothetical protein Scaly_2982500 [Sesamum calycinum]|uniref:Reverse transcriptase Ty1/copia-type domain-containing protein n=1 Tax=Sesamum calycinum TaxID=2727403 RepID=A0AAW2KKT2_9LAMI
MMSFTGLPPSFWDYALETVAKLLNMALSKMVPQTPYEIWHGKITLDMYLRVWGSPTYVKRLVGDKLDSRLVYADPPKGVRPVGCKWVYKHKLGADGEVTTFKARRVVKGYTQRPGVDFEKTDSSIAMGQIHKDTACHSSMI